jgi:membrane protein
LENIDKQIALLHQQKKQTFYSALLLEYTARVVSCLEIWLILNVLTTHVSFADCCLIAAFSSLLANLLFFLPMQLGGREGGFALAVGGLSLSGAYGVYAALITRIREMVWIVIGLVLMKVGNFKQSKERYSA